jgi:hypothetical protein
VPDLVTYATEANWQMYYMVLDKLAALGVRGGFDFTDVFQDGPFEFAV